MISTTAPNWTAPRPVYPKSLEESNSSAGRMRLPPPPRKYSPISVMARTLETVSRPNSRSMAERSSRNRSKISFREMVAGLPNSFIASVGPVVGELHVNAKISAPEQGHDFLQGVAIFAADANGVTLDGSLHFFLRILDRLYDLARLLHRDALLHGDLLPHRCPRRRFNHAIGQRLDGHAALYQLGLQNVVDRLEFVVIHGRENNRVFALEHDVGLGIFQIKAGMDLLQRVLDRVRDLLQVNLADNVK